MKHTCLTVALAVLLVCLPPGFAAANGINVSDLEGGAPIIGHLGIPLGELATIRARAVSSGSKETEMLLELLEVNGRPLPAPVRFQFTIWQWGNLAGRTLAPSQTLVVRVYETGGMAGVPDAAMRETVYVQSPGWGFRTSLVVLYEVR